MQHIIAAVVEAIANLEMRSAPKTYLFGSALSRTSVWSDIDILIVCELESDGQVIRSALKEIISHYPIDLIIMTHEEEREFKFIESEGCRLIS